ncbi:hypothetical protein BpHYR1_050734 [Brachionus plicatilis]|uniref:Uncharacterized protein n=1 Tax=Brachionus plicatilis TaxID=10195 RepID=A0A3M7R3F1_BRAPC|nr:hypothetical protein BpHYR1_050734 [Brachionus plicatilis]
MSSLSIGVVGLIVNLNAYFLFFLQVVILFSSMRFFGDKKMPPSNSDSCWKKNEISTQLE